MLVFACAAALVLLRSAIFVFFDSVFDSVFDSDQAVVGLMAKHLSKDGRCRSSNTDRTISSLSKRGSLPPSSGSSAPRYWP
jgi:hypothetical protein